MLNVRVDSSIGSSKVIPIFHQVVLTDQNGREEHENIHNNNLPAESVAVEEVLSNTIIGIPEEDEFSGEMNPQDAWLPITESRKGNTLTAALHLLSSGIGTQALLLPFAFISLGWYVMLIQSLFLNSIYVYNYIIISSLPNSLVNSLPNIYNLC